MASRRREGRQVMNPIRHIIQVGIDHRSGSLEDVERLHSSRSKNGSPVELPANSGVVAMETCHRLELYFEGLTEDSCIDIFHAWSGITGRDDAPRPVVRSGKDAARHLLRVVSGIESAVLGEDQIISQARSAYRNACTAGTAGPFLHRLFHSSFRTGKRVRTETDLARGGRSMAGAAVAVMHQRLGGLRGKTVMVLGTGEIGSLAASRLRKREVGHLILSNRTRSSAASLAGRLRAKVIRWEWWAGALAEVDGLVCATGAPDPVVKARALQDAAEGRKSPLVVIDLAVPRNVEKPAAPVQQLTVLDVEALSRRLDSEAGMRQDAVQTAQGIVEEELNEWLAWAERRRNYRSGASSRPRGEKAAN